MAFSPSASSPSTTDVAREKKLVRDRRAQQNSRDRRNRHINALEQELAHHRDESAAKDARISELAQECNDLKAENQRLSARRQQIFDLATAWQTEEAYYTGKNSQTIRQSVEDPASMDSTAQSDAITNTPPVSMALNTLHEHPVSSSLPPVIPSLQTLIQCASDVDTLPILPSIAGTLDPAPLPVSNGPSLWSMTPFSIDDGQPLKSLPPRPLLKELVIGTPDTPEPLELLYGSRTNRLADIIHSRGRAMGSADTERLASGWLIYLMVKWIFEPTEARFLRLPGFLKPTLEQIRHPHPVIIDTLAWPSVRTKLIKNRQAYDLDAVAWSFACCQKVRWPWGKSILEPKDDGTLGIVPDFIRTFMSIEGWGLTSEFIQHYPELVEGLDIEKIRWVVVSEQG
jgi:hypothetical protein